MVELITKNVINEDTGEQEEIVVNEKELGTLLEAAKRKGPVKTYTMEEINKEGFSFLDD